MRRFLCVVVLCSLGCAGLASSASARTVSPLPAQWQKGVNLTAFWWTDLSGAPFTRWLGLARTSAHADTVTFVVTWYQNTKSSTSIHPSYGRKKLCAHIGDSWRHCKTPSMAALTAAVRAAKAQHLKVAIRPQVDVGRNGASTVSREKIDVQGAARKAWFASYANMLSQYARLARDTKAQTLVVGADLTGMTNDQDDQNYWRHLIDDARSGALLGDAGHGYGGTMTYAMTWQAANAEAADPAVHRFVWDDLNEIGVDAYFPLVKVSQPHDDPPVSVLAAGWRAPLASVRALHAEFDKPVLFTGLGYLSRIGTSTAPGNGDAQQKANGGRLSQTAQSRPVQAAFDVWSRVAAAAPWFQGIWWWEWPAAGRGGPKDGSHSVEGKLAQAELCRRHAGSAKATCPVTKHVP